MRVTGSKDDAVEAEPREVGCSIVATDMSAGCLLERLDRSLALEMRVGTSERTAEFIYAFVVEAAIAVWVTRRCFRDNGRCTFACRLRLVFRAPDGVRI